MTAGSNVLFRCFRMTDMADDYVGGASISGSVVYHAIPGRFQEQDTTQVFIEQGIESPRVFTANLVGTFLLLERDELQLIAPQDHWDYGKRFRVIGVAHADHNPRDPRAYLRVQMVRSEKAHAQQ